MPTARRITPHDIAIGRVLTQDMFDVDGILLMKQGQAPESQKQLQYLLARGYFAPPGALRDEDYFYAIAPKKETPPTPFDVMDGIYSHLTELSRPDTPKNDFTTRIVKLCRTIQRICVKDADASLAALYLNREGHYAITHQIHCALVCEILLTHIGQSAAERLPYLAAALTMNIAMISLQQILINQKDTLNYVQKREIKEHPRRGVELLRSYGVAHEGWLDTVYQHHESIDGSGYPQGLKGEAISQTAHILSLSDIYCAKLYPRSYRAPLPPEAAARSIFTALQQKSFNPELGGAFLKQLGIFHPGSFVRLINGEIAIVTRRGEKIHHPIVHSLMSHNGTPFLQPRKRDCSLNEFAITDSVTHTEVTIAINKKQIWGYN